MKKNHEHTFHIPVMGLGYTIDCPIRIAHYGISSVLSITDDEVIEKMRAFYSNKFSLPYEEITQKAEDFRAKRITNYLNLVSKIVQENFEKFKNELSINKSKLENFISILPNSSDLKLTLQNFANEGLLVKDTIKNYLDLNFTAGSIDVNIMTKVDKDNYDKDTLLPLGYSDALSSLRGFAQSDLESSVVFSAGMNPRLYSYIENFKDFFPDNNENLRKKIILKVSDFRSALIQGNFLAKKGLWVSEYRIESGLNCGGHAFATNGFLMGPILEEFKQKKQQLIESAFSLLVKSLDQKGMPIPTKPLEMKITAQGGVGTAEEHEFLLRNYNLDTIGWGSPFLLVPEATSLDPETRDILMKAKEDDFYLSDISPLGIPFNTVKGTSNEFWKNKRIDDKNSGSSCPKKFLALSKEYDEKGICPASKKYQDIKFEELNLSNIDHTSAEYKKLKSKITEKSCLCVGLVNAAYLDSDIAIKGQQQGVVICPGPNLAYFDKEVSLVDMIKHIYGSIDIINKTIDRPNLFIKELKMYIDYLTKEIDEWSVDLIPSQIKKWNTFKSNLLTGIEYYRNLFSQSEYFVHSKDKNQEQLNKYEIMVQSIDIPTLVASCK